MCANRRKLIHNARQSFDTACKNDRKTLRYRDFHAFLEDIIFTVRAPWTIDASAQYEGVLDEVRVMNIDFSPNRQLSPKIWYNLGE